MKAKFMEILTMIVVLGEIVMIGLMLWIWKFGASTVDPNVVNLVYGLALGFHSGFMLVLGYWFGSSKGSAEKTQLMSDASTLAARNLNDKTVITP
jgi:hypothetical protein